MHEELKRGPKPNLKRYRKMVELRQQGKTLEAIGKSFDPPMSRQAVFDTLKKDYPLDDCQNEA